MPGWWKIPLPIRRVNRGRSSPQHRESSDLKDSTTGESPHGFVCVIVRARISFADAFVDFAGFYWIGKDSFLQARAGNNDDTCSRCRRSSLPRRAYFPAAVADWAGLTGRCVSFSVPPSVGEYAVRMSGVAFGRLCLAVLAFAMLVLAPQLATAQLSVRPVQPKSDYFRFKAKYTVIATGEVVEFDLVRPCFVVSGRDITGDSVGLPPHKPSGYFNGISKFPKVTSDHHAIVVRIPRACDGDTTANGKVPKDLLPFTTWFDDADDLSYGWQYTSEDAYKSSFAKLRFDGASIEAAGKSDFLAWQRQAHDDFRPTKLLQSPFGFSFELLSSSDDIASSCWGVKRLTLPSEIRELAKAVQPEDHPRFWTVPPQKENRSPIQDMLYKAVWGTESDRHRFNDGNHRSVLEWGLDVADGLESVPTRLNGALGRPRVRSPDFFPLISAPYGLPFMTPERLAAPTLYFDVDVRPEMRGFTACYAITSAMGRNFRTQVPDAERHDFRWRIDGQAVAGQWQLNPRDPVSPSRFFERDEFAYEDALNPM